MDDPLQNIRYQLQLHTINYLGEIVWFLYYYLNKNIRFLRVCNCIIEINEKSGRYEDVKEWGLKYDPSYIIHLTTIK